VRRDPYRVLGIPHGASPAVVLDAYRRLSKLHHPDREGGSPERFLEIQQAYETLRARPAPDASLEERLAALEHDVRQSATRTAGRDAHADATVRGVNDLVDGLDDLSSQLDR
jgi:DnaJ-class molecular chaperone